MQELKPCPFCGGEATIVERVIKGGYKVYYVKCKECGVRRNELPKTADGACDLWNRRACRMATVLVYCAHKEHPDECYECTQCGYIPADENPLYCPNCGAKVVDDD